MVSIFDLINTYQDGIVASITFILGTVETGVCSWAIHRLMMDEQFLIYIIGHAMYKKTKNLQEAMAHYYSLRSYLKSDLFEIIFIMKAALSCCLVAGACLTLASMSMLCLGAKPYGRRLWIVISSISLLGFIGGFGLAMIFLVQNILYMQIFLAVTAVNSFLLIHLILSITFQEIYVIWTNRKKSAVSSSETQTSSISVQIQDEFPLPVPPPTPPSTSTSSIPQSASRSNSTTTTR